MSAHDRPLRETAFDFSATAIDGREIALEMFRGHVLLVVNVASRCGYTPQYAALEALHRRHRDRGLSVLGFPCNQFGGQEPGTNADIQTFCRDRYDVTFPIFARIDVNGRAAHPLFAFLKSRRKGWMGFEAIRWNFTKFLVGRTGDVAGRYGPMTTPESIEPHILNALDARPPARVGE